MIKSYDEDYKRSSSNQGKDETIVEQGKDNKTTKAKKQLGALFRGGEGKDDVFRPISEYQDYLDELC